MITRLFVTNPSSSRRRHTFVTPPPDLNLTSRVLMYDVRFLGQFGTLQV